MRGRSEQTDELEECQNEGCGVKKERVWDKVAGQVMTMESHGEARHSEAGQTFTLNSANSSDQPRETLQIERPPDNQRPSVGGGRVVEGIQKEKG